MKKVRKKVIEISTRIVTISPEQGWWQRKWSMLYAKMHCLPVIDVSEPTEAIVRTLFRNWIDRQSKYLYALWPGTIHKCPILLPEKGRYSKKTKPVSKQYDTGLKVLARTRQGKVVSSWWQLQLRGEHAHLLLLSSYYPEPSASLPSNSQDCNT